LRCRASPARPPIRARSRRKEIAANQIQVDSILNSINRSANTTQFNGVKLLNGSLDYTTSA